MTTVHETDAVIIGAGPVGLFAVFELGLLDIRAQLVDVLPRPGGQCAELYPDKPLYDIPALPVVSGAELTDRLLAQISPFSPVFHLGQTVTHAERAGGGWRVATDAGTVIACKVVVIASGGGSFTPKKPHVEGLADFEGRGVFYAVRDRAAFAGKEIVVAGGGDSALDWALALEPTARRVTLLHRSRDFRAAPHSVSKMRALVEAGKMDFAAGAIEGVKGRGGELSSVTAGGREIPCDALLVFYGLTMRPGPLGDICAQAGVSMKDGLIPVDTEKFETNVPGVFAVGDINTYPGKLKLILSGFHETALMARRAFALVHPERTFRLEYTTSSTAMHKRLGVK